MTAVAQQRGEWWQMRQKSGPGNMLREIEGESLRKEGKSNPWKFASPFK